MRITYVGHATLLIEIGGRRFLTDPNFDPRLGRVLRRVAEPGMLVEQLPRLDGILLTHAHADHLSFSSLDLLPRDIPLFAPPSLARWLTKLGYRHAEPLAAGEDVRIGDLSVFAARAQHVGARYGVDRWRADTNMYLLNSAADSAFFAGDTALTPASHGLVEQVLHSSGRELDVALLPIGHAPMWKRAVFRRGHLTPEDALSFYTRLRARWFIPYHWGTFNHLTSGAHDAIAQLRSLVQGHEGREGVRILEVGQAWANKPDPNP
ncbi:MAG TPA: MBL fold metallo-hydrolase [Gemmatimonadales bacterium]|nr:MBL fold metallo-hydrolase [Gemmatimonadales bacterium]